MRLTLPFYYPWKKKNDYKQKNRTLLKIKEKQKPNEYFILPYAYYAKIFPPILTYANDANRIQPRLRNGKRKKNQTTILCMCHGPEVYDAAIVVTWVPCPYLQK